MQLDRDFTAALNALNRALGTDMALISSIEGEVYRVVAVASRLAFVKPGDLFETGNTYCAQVLAEQDMVTYAEVGTEEAMRLHPVYSAMQLEAYIGEPLRRGGRIVGTLNFSGLMPKRPTFSETEKARVKDLAREIETAIIDDSV